MIATAAPVAAGRGRLPGSFAVWLTGALVSQLGDAVLYFALGWTASAHGGRAAGLVLSGVAISRTALLLFGGVGGDRWGARRVMIAGDSIMLVLATVLGLVAAVNAVPLGVLVLVALVIGVVDAFYLPSAGSMPRRLVDEAALPRALALRQSGSQLITIAGGPLGGLLVAAAGLAAAAWLDAATFAIVLAVLITIRSRIQIPTPPKRPLLGELADGIRTTIHTPGLGAALLLVAGVAGLITPVTSLLVPLLVRGHGWTPADAGLIIGGQSLGTIAVTLVVARTGVPARPAYRALGGLVLAATGETLLATSSRVGFAITAGAMLGIGAGLFVSHLSPVLLTSAPRTHLARVQSLLSLAQSAALLIMNNVLGVTAQATTARSTVFVCAGALALVTAAALGSGTVRRISPRPAGQ